MLQLLGWKSRALNPVQRPDDVYRALCDPLRYKKIFALLEKRFERSPRQQNTFANHEELDLRWILRRRKLVSRWILRGMRNRDHQVSPAREIKCRVGGKERLFYRLEWPDRILQTVLSSLLAEYWDPIFSPNLYSYRKGFSAPQAVRKAARWLKSTEGQSAYVLKRDVKSYGDSIPHDRLITLVEENLRGVDPFVLQLVRQFVAFRYVGLDQRTRSKEEGLPTGMPLNCVLENLYLTPLDHAMSSCPDIFYTRYGDDIWVSSRTRQAADSAREQLEASARDARLHWHPEKCADFVLATRAKTHEAGVPEWQQVERVPHLGIDITPAGRIVIPPDKLKAWRLQLKQVLKRADFFGRRLGLSLRERIRQLVKFTTRYLNTRTAGFPKIDYLLTVVTDDADFIDLDRWVAQTILSVCYGRFSKANFRRTPYRQLREDGLPSLFLRRKEMLSRNRRRRKGRAGARRAALPSPS